jgi:hypothetical protein
MRRLLTAALLAGLAATATPAHAYSTGVGAVAIPVSSFFRPNVGVAGAGVCTFDGAVVTAAVVGVAVTGVIANESVHCTVENAFGTPLADVWAYGSAGGGANYEPALLFDKPVRICGTVTVDSAAWGPATATSCASVLPGNPKA